MSYKIISFIIMNVAFWGYVIPMSALYGIPVSISDTYYKLRRNLQVLFTLSMWGFAIPAIILGVEQSGLAFFAGCGIAFVGASPAFRKDAINGVSTMEAIVHRVGAITAIIASQAMILFADVLWLFSAWFMLCAVALLPRFRKNSIFYIEIISFMSVAVFYFLLLV